ncbi:unnamed protein product [Mucor hiemalis]
MSDTVKKSKNCKGRVEGSKNKPKPTPPGQLRIMHTMTGSSVNTVQHISAVQDTTVKGNEYEVDENEGMSATFSSLKDADLLRFIYEELAKSILRCSNVHPRVRYKPDATIKSSVIMETVNDEPAFDEEDELHIESPSIMSTPIIFELENAEPELVMDYYNAVCPEANNLLEDERRDNSFRCEIDCDKGDILDAEEVFSSDILENEISNEAIVAEENVSALREGGYVAEYIIKIISNLHKNKQEDKIRLPVEYEKGKKFWVDNHDPFALKKNVDPSCFPLVPRPSH